jgi:hypothetical protein
MGIQQRGCLGLEQQWGYNNGDVWDLNNNGDVWDLNNNGDVWDLNNNGDVWDLNNNGDVWDLNNNGDVWDLNNNGDENRDHDSLSFKKNWICEAKPVFCNGITPI